MITSAYYSNTPDQRMARAEQYKKSLIKQAELENALNEAKIRGLRSSGDILKADIYSKELDKKEDRVKTLADLLQKKRDQGFRTSIVHAKKGEEEYITKLKTKLPWVPEKIIDKIVKDTPVVLLVKIVDEIDYYKREWYDEYRKMTKNLIEKSRHLSNIQKEEVRNSHWRKLLDTLKLWDKNTSNIELDLFSKPITGEPIQLDMAQQILGYQKTEVKEKTRIYQNNVRLIQELTGSIDTLRRGIVEKQESINRLQDLLTDASIEETERRKINKDIARKTSKIRNAENRITNIEEEIRIKQEENEDINRRLSELGYSSFDNQNPRVQPPQDDDPQDDDPNVVNLWVDDEPGVQDVKEEKDGKQGRGAHIYSKEEVERWRDPGLRAIRGSGKKKKAMKKGKGKGGMDAVDVKVSELINEINNLKVEIRLRKNSMYSNGYNDPEVAPLQTKLRRLITRFRKNRIDEIGLPNDLGNIIKDYDDDISSGEDEPGGGGGGGGGGPRRGSDNPHFWGFGAKKKGKGNVLGCCKKPTYVEKADLKKEKKRRQEKRRELDYLAPVSVSDESDWNSDRREAQDRKDSLDRKEVYGYGGIKKTRIGRVTIGAGIKVGAGIKRPDKYNVKESKLVSFGVYLLNVSKLVDSNMFQIVYKNDTKRQVIPQVQVNDRFRKIIFKMLDGENIRDEEFDRLSDNEREYLFVVLKKSGFLQDYKLITRLNVLRGVKGAGNNSPHIDDEIRSIYRKLNLR